MNKDLLMEFLIQDVERVTKDIKGSVSTRPEDLESVLTELNNRREALLPKLLPKKVEDMIPVLREHFSDDVTKISLVLNSFFPERYLYYRVSQLEREIFDGFSFFADEYPDLGFPFDSIGKHGFDRYLILNDQLFKFSRKVWPKTRQPQKKLWWFLFQGLAALFREKEDYNRYWILLSSEIDFEALDQQESVNWSGRKEMKQGDLVFMYRTTPRKAITDLYEVAWDPVFDHCAGWKGFWVDLTYLASIPDIGYQTLLKDPILGRWGLVRRGFVGTTAEPIPYFIYNRLLEFIPSEIKKIFEMAPESFVEAGSVDEYASEKEFQEKVVAPLLQRWALKYDLEYPCRFRIGCQDIHARIDCLIRGKDGPVTVVECKLSLGEKERLKAIFQAKSYALQLGLQSFLLASPQGFWFFKLQGGKAELAVHVPMHEIKDSEREEALRALILGTR